MCRTTMFKDIQWGSSGRPGNGNSRNRTYFPYEKTKPTPNHSSECWNCSVTNLLYVESFLLLPVFLLSSYDGENLSPNLICDDKTRRQCFCSEEHFNWIKFNSLKLSRISKLLNLQLIQVINTSKSSATMLLGNGQRQGHVSETCYDFSIQFGTI